jgi:hypothetical protein
MKSEVQHENIKRLQAAVQAAFATAACQPLKGALVCSQCHILQLNCCCDHDQQVDCIQVGGRRRCAQAHDMDLVMQALRSAHKGQGHPFAASFVEACRRHCSPLLPELPFTITKQQNSFSVSKVYLVKADERCEHCIDFTIDSL